MLPNTNNTPFTMYNNNLQLQINNLLQNYPFFRPPPQQTPFTGFNNLNLHTDLTNNATPQKTIKQTTRKRSAKASSAYRGVYWNKNCKAWRARIWVNGKSEHLGNFDDEEQAARAFDKRAHELGRYDSLNFPKDNGSRDRTSKRIDDIFETNRVQQLLATTAPQIPSLPYFLPCPLKRQRTQDERTEDLKN
mmetsp:Transcript_11750/g.19161  ORF Transcript_11750/g.19161 Transcript_11750/m.19161 type:complete len:191 (+) Transcript_11750:503-1075(+)